MSKIYNTILIIFLILAWSCSPTKRNLKSNKAQKIDTLQTAAQSIGQSDFYVQFLAGPAHNNPTFAIWIEDSEYNFVDNIFVTESVATGIYDFGQTIDGKWRPGKRDYPSALPHWRHKVKAEKKIDNDIDGFSGPTPPAGFIYGFNLPSHLNDGYITAEVNQPWDFNYFWTNNKFPGDEDYKRSCQPALIYRASIIKLRESGMAEFMLIGHSHPSGDDGEIYEDTSTFTTAMQIFEIMLIKAIQ